MNEKRILLMLFKILTKITYSKIFNLLVLQLSYIISRVTKKPLTWGSPAFLSIEPTNVCNLQCLECPTGMGTSVIPKGYIDNKLIDKLLPLIKKSVLHVNLFFQGEPFLHKDIVLQINKISKHTLVTVSTNGHFLTPDITDALAKSGLYKIIVSLDGYDQQSYEKYRRNGSFDKVIDGIINMVESKKQLQVHFPIIEIQCLLFKHTEAKQTEISKLAKSLGADNVIFKTAQFYDFQHAKEMLPSAKNSRYEIDNEEIIIKSKKPNSCWRSWSGMVVCWNGDVISCCFDKDKNHVYFNIAEEIPKSVFKQAQVLAFRKSILTNRSAISMCNNCTEGLRL